MRIPFNYYFSRVTGQIFPVEITSDPKETLSNPTEGPGDLVQPEYGTDCTRITRNGQIDGYGLSIFFFVFRMGEFVVLHITNITVCYAKTRKYVNVGTFYDG